jgi:23S rRNA pseudouridine1911/1915/1917 synthase
LALCISGPISALGLYHEPHHASKSHGAADVEPGSRDVRGNFESQGAGSLLYTIMSSETQTLSVIEGEGARIDAYLAARITELTRTAIERLINEGHITVNAKPVKPKYKVRIGDDITILIPAPGETHIVAEDIPIDIVYQDDDIAVINKPRGMTTHPAPGSTAGTLVNALLSKITNLSGIGGVKRPGIVHRLDKDTSGLLVVAKNDAAHLDLQSQIQAKTAMRRYYTIVWGDTKFEKAAVETPIGRHPTHRQKQAVIPEGPTSRDAATDLTVIERLDGFTLVEASLRTGRTHQIRVHCAYIGHPVVGDPLYGGRRRDLPGRFGPKAKMEFEKLLEELNGQALHAYNLSFNHPRTRERLEFRAPMPQPMAELLEWMRGRKEVTGDR